MILNSLIVYFVTGSVLTHVNHGAQIDFSTSKPLMCGYTGNKVGVSSTDVPVMDPDMIPSECEVILYTDVLISNTSDFDYSTDILERVTGSSTPVLLLLRRELGFYDWGSILTSDGNAEDAKAVTDFALSNNVQGVLLTGLAPETMLDTFNANISAYIVPYLRQLKIDDDFIVGVVVDPISAFIKNPCVYDFEAMNDIVDLYVINTDELNQCKPNVNLPSPLHGTPFGSNYVIGMDTVSSFLTASDISPTKIYYVIDLRPVDINSTDSYASYSQVCKGQADCASWCVPTTQTYYDKAKYLQEQNCGILVKWVELDDIDDDCGCSPFVGLLNVVAGFYGDPPVPCDKYDIQSGSYGIQ